MGVPATTGVLATKITDMKVGDYIACEFDSSVTGGKFTINKTDKGESPTGGFTGAGQRFFYFVKVAKGLCVSDRVIYHTYAWDSLNSQKNAQGRPVTLGEVLGTIRSLTGGVGYADVNGNLSLPSDLGYGGFPLNNEWDKYIVNFPTEYIQSGKTLDDVFHWTSNRNWVQDATANGVVYAGNTATNIYRNVRPANATDIKSFATTSSNNSVSSIGFRPVFEYKEV